MKRCRNLELIFRSTRDEAIRQEKSAKFGNLRKFGTSRKETSDFEMQTAIRYVVFGFDIISLS